MRDDDELFVYGTDPLIADTDNDGWSDGVEIAEGFDPLDPTSHPEPPPGDSGGSDGLLTGLGIFAIAGSVLLVGGYAVTKYVRRYRRLTKEDAIDYLEHVQSMVDDIDRE